MLDECKGERLEEVLAVFSSAVLKKLVAERALNSGPEYRPTISENISLENWGYSGDRTELNALLLAHKVSLRSLLSRKNAARAKYRDFEELLALKERGIARRKEQIKVETERSVAETSERVRTEIYRVVRTNWTGNDQWVDSLLFNDTNPRTGGLLGSRFDDVWAGVCEGRISDLEDQNAGLLEQLDHRVRLQKARLEKWDDFRKKMFGSMPQQSPKKAKAASKPKAVDFGFTAHRQLNIDHIDTKVQISSIVPPPPYDKIIDHMKAELYAISRPKVPDFSKLLGGSKRDSMVDAVSSLVRPHRVVDSISDISEWEDEPDEELRPVPIPTQPPAGRRYLAPPKAGVESTGQIPKVSSAARPYGRTHKASSGVPHEVETSVQEPLSQPSISTESLRRHEITGLEDRAPVSTSRNAVSRDISPSELLHPRKAMEPMPPPRSVSPTQAMADEILASMSNASPSPMKKQRHTLSLADRTRMSMSRTRSYEKDDDTSQLSPTKSIHEETNTENATNPIPKQGEEYEDLVARTRRSMAGFEAARQKAQLERRRSQRKSKAPQRKDSHFPRLEEEDIHDTSIAEELIEAGQEDYEAVFRSRPRVQTSPLPSPSKMWSEE